MAGFDPKAYAAGGDDVSPVAAPFDPKIYAAGGSQNPSVGEALGLSLPKSGNDFASRIAGGGSLLRAAPPPPATTLDPSNGLQKIDDPTANAVAGAGNSAPAFPLYEGAGLGMAAARIGANAAIGGVDAATKGGDPLAEGGKSAGIAAGLEALPYVGSAAAKVVGPALNAGTNLIGKAVYTVGHVFTGMDAGDALRAQQSLSSLQMMVPDAYIDSAGKAVGAARQVLQAENVTVPGSHDVAQNVINTIEAAKLRGLQHPNADAVVSAIKQRAFEAVQESHTAVVPPWEADAHVDATQSQLNDVTSKLAQIDQQRSAAVAAALQANGMPMTPETIAGIGPTLDSHPGIAQMEGIRGQLLDQHQQLTSELTDMAQKKASGIPLTQTQVTASLKPRDLTLPELDDLTGMMDELGFNASGSPKQLRRIWAPAVASSRGALNDVMQSVPEGELFQSEKDPFRNLSMASQMNTGMRTTVVGSAISSAASAASVAVGHASLVPGALIMASLQPRSYFGLMGALKIPQDVVGMFSGAQASGKVGLIRDALDSLAQKNPEMAENIVRGANLISQKPPTAQYLTDDEANSLGKTRIFDAGQIMAEKQRIKTDNSMSSVEKAAALSDINRNGYVTMPGPTTPQMPQTPQIAPDNDDDKMSSFYRSLQRTGE